MPKVHTVKKARKAYPNAGIEPGDTYYWWEFRFGGTYRSKTYPKRSQLTQSKKAGAYEAFENIEAALEARSTPDLSGAIDEYSGALMDIAEEYREAAEPFGGEGENAERAEAYNDAADQASSFDVSEYEQRLEEIEAMADGAKDDDGNTKEELLDTLWEEVDSAAQELDPDSLIQV